VNAAGDAEVRARMSARLAELREELRRGEVQLRELVQRESALRESMLRISGAAQVLAELLEDGTAPDVPEAGRAATAAGRTAEDPRVLTVT
jgi:hypothetical protein